VYGAAVPHDIVVRNDELLERRVNVVEIDVGDEAIDAGVDAGGRLAVRVATSRNDIREHPQIGEPAGHGGVGRVAADALVVIALRVVGLRLPQAFLGQAGVLT
jgi:hypothetical protein